MRCARCQGLMVQDRFYDLLDDCGLVSLTAWRCVCCGNVVDPIILRNRRKFQIASQVGQQSGLSCSGLTVSSARRLSA